MSDVVGRSLGRRGYSVTTAHVSDAATAVAWQQPQLVVLDAQLAGAGWALLDQLRADGVPVVLVSASAGESERVYGLERGADDFVPSPVSPDELAARVKSVLRRHRRRTAVTAPGPGPASAPSAPVVVDERSRRVLVKGRPVRVTALEFKLLSFLVSHADEALSRQRLLEEVWGYTVGGVETVTVHVRRVREKIEDDPANPMLIRTVWGVGYRFSLAEG